MVSARLFLLAHPVDEAVSLDVRWPDGRQFRYRITAAEVRAEGFESERTDACPRKAIDLILLIEGPDQAVTVVMQRRPSARHRLGQWWRWSRRQGTGPFDDPVWGTIAEGADPASLAAALQRMGYAVRRATWDAVSPGSA